MPDLTESQRRKRVYAVSRGRFELVAELVLGLPGVDASPEAFGIEAHRSSERQNAGLVAWTAIEKAVAEIIVAAKLLGTDGGTSLQARAQSARPLHVGIAFAFLGVAPVDDSQVRASANCSKELVQVSAVRALKIEIDGQWRWGGARGRSRDRGQRIAQS